LLASGFEPIAADVSQIASTTAPLEKDDAEKLLRMVDFLEDLDDVQNVYTNAEISAEVMASLDG